MNRATTSAPGKLILLGEHAVVYGYPTIVTAVNQRVYVELEKTQDVMFRLEAPDLGLQLYEKKIKDLGKDNPPKAVQFTEALLKRFWEKYPQTGGVKTSTRSDFSATFGFGSSSAVTVALGKALCWLYEIELTNKELFDLCYRAVIDVQGVGSGFDIAAAIWGGTIYYVPPAKVVRQLNVGQLPIVVGYTGIKADTPTLVRMVAQKRQENEAAMEAVFKEMQSLTDRAEKAMVAEEWEEVGRLMNTNHDLLRSLNVSGVELERLTQAAIKAGAQGAKLSGAGGGDCMIALVETSNRSKVEQAIKNNKGEVMGVELGAEGVRIEKWPIK